MAHAATSTDAPLLVLGSHESFPEVRMIEPATSGFALIAAEIERRPPLLGSSRRKRRLLAECKEVCRAMQRQNGAVDSTVFRAIVVPPGCGGPYANQRMSLYSTWRS
jgi:hypothetical protein